MGSRSLREALRGVNERQRPAWSPPFVGRRAAVVQNARWAAPGETLHSFEPNPLAGFPDDHRRFPLTPYFPARATLATALLVLLPALAPAAQSAPAKSPAKAAAAAPAAQRELTILYGDDHAFGLVVPAGWTVDDTSGINSRIRVVLYPKGQKWATAPTVMYVNPIHQKKDARKTLRQVIEQDISELKKRSPNARVSAQPALKTGAAQVAEVRYFSPTGAEPLEAVAYVAEQDLVMLLVLQSRDPAGFRSNLAAFDSLVSGYQFVAGGIQTPK